jgi:hypothetical protein
MKYTITLSAEQMGLIASCLQDVSRFASGQCELDFTISAMLRHLPFEEKLEREKEATALLRKLKKVLFPDMLDNSSLSYNGTEFIGNTYRIYRTMLYHLAIDNDWNNVWSSPALPSGNMGTIEIHKLNQ